MSHRKLSVVSGGGGSPLVRRSANPKVRQSENEIRSASPKSKKRSAGPKRKEGPVVPKQEKVR